MRRETGFRVAVALLAIVSLGVGATTLESTLRTDANEAVNLDFETLPIGEDDASAIVDEMEQAKPDVNGEPGQRKPEPDPSSASDNPRPNEESGEQQRQQQQQRDQAASGGSQPTEPSLLERLLDLLEALAPVVLGLVAVLAVIGALVRYRDRLRALFDRSNEPVEDDSSVAPPESSPLKQPSNAVDHAWAEMVRRLDLDRRATMTPEELARAAVEAGFDSEAVRTLTETFEEVRYGSQPVTERRERIARESQQQLDRGRGS